MPIVDDADVQIHLPVDTLTVEAIPDDREKAYEDAERIIRGYLAGVVDSAVMATWTTPATTPEIVRAIGGRLAAAAIYRLRYGQGALNDPEYAQVKYNEAMKMLEDIIAGDLLIEEVPDTTIFDDSYFWPNDSTDPPKFTMAGRY